MRYKIIILVLFIINFVSLPILAQTSANYTPYIWIDESTVPDTKQKIYYEIITEDKKIIQPEFSSCKYRIDYATENFPETK